MKFTKAYLLNALPLLVLAAALALLGNGLWLNAKAVLAQVLIAEAWERGPAERPWPWADTYPRARLQSPALNVDLYVLQGAHDATLAFGPGWQSGSQGKTVVLSAHRDTHFAFLREITPGEELWLSERPGKTRRYRVAETAVVDSAGGPLLLEPALDALLLTTCYPFDALLPGGSERFVVLAYPAADPITQQQVVKL